MHTGSVGKTLLLLFTLFQFTLSAQIRINEVAATGTALTDEDGDRPDWLELRNVGPQPVSVWNFGLTDDPAVPHKWRLPDVTLAAGEARVVFASDKNRPPDPNMGGGSAPVHHWETAVYDDNTWQYLPDPSGTSANWIMPAYQPSGWLNGPGGIGYSDGDDQSEVPAGTLSVYARCGFNIADKSQIVAALLNIDYDDGFVAYLNGVEIARDGLGGQPPAWDELAADHEAQLYAGGIPTEFSLDFSAVSALLVDGPNVLAVEIHNTSPGSSDLTLRPFLHFGMATAANQFGPNPAWFLPPPGSTVDNLHTNFKLKAGETLALFDATGALLDSIGVLDLRSGDVQARIPDNWCITDEPTPNLSNNAATCYSGYAAEPVFSPPAGFYNGTQHVSISGAGVRYAAGGAVPDATSTLYTGPIAVGQTRVLRAVSIQSGKLPSRPVTATYFINEPTQLPVVSLVARPGDLFNDGTGPAIYDNFWSGEKVPCNVAYFDKNHAQQLNKNASARVVGNFSIEFAQKSLQFIFENNGTGNNTAPNVIFNDDKPALAQLSGFRVRNTDDDANQARMRDVIVNRMALPTAAVATASQNVAVFINGNYWGHYSARELLNEDFLADNYGVDPDSVDIIKTHVGNTFADEGSLADFLDMRDFLIQTDLSQPANYGLATQRIDTDNWVDYWAVQIFAANADWYSSMYQNNIQCYRSYAPDTKWKFEIWDAGLSQNAGLGECTPYFNSLDFALTNPAFPNQYTDMFNSLLNNTGFRRYFINRFADLINWHWTTPKMHQMVDANAAAMAGEVEANYARWISDCGGYYCPPDLPDWMYRVQTIKDFYTERPDYQRNHIEDHFNLNGQVNVTLAVSPPGAGYVRISTVTPDAYPWSGVYFHGNPVTVTAIAKPGYTFAHWSANGFISNVNQPEFTADISQNTVFTANFTGVAAALDLTCSEINYNSAQGSPSGNWVELHNFGTGPVDLGGYRLQEMGASDYYTIPAGTTIPAGGYRVFADDKAVFQAAYPGVVNVTGPTLIGLGNNGDTLALRDPFGALLLTIGYDDNSNWPQCADGFGRTLENANTGSASGLLDPANWFNGCMGGSPGVGYTPCNETLIFNEINYKSSPDADAGDWVELLNKSGQTLDLSGRQFRDSNDTLRFTFPAGTFLPADSFLVIYSDLAKFQSVHPGSITYFTGPFLFGLDGDGEVIRLFDANEKIVLSMFYQDVAPWPLPPDGEGPTLELTAPFTDLNMGQNWEASCFFGTPGRPNTDCFSGSGEIDATGQLAVYPNPSSGIFWVRHVETEARPWKLTDLSGRVLRDGVSPAGQSRWRVDGSGMAAGMYLLEITGGRPLLVVVASPGR